MGIQQYPIIEGEKGVGAVQFRAHVSRVLLARGSRFAHAMLTFCSRDARVLLTRCSRFAREVLALCSRGTRGIPFWCLQPLCPSIGPVFLSGCFGGFWERVFLLFLGRGQGVLTKRI